MMNTSPLPMQLLRLKLRTHGLVETKDLWTWFLNLLFADIGDGQRWVFISDQ